MKLLSNLENLDNIVDGDNKKLDLHYMDLTTSSSEPFVFNDIKPGLYINTNAHRSGYFYCKLNDSSTAVLNNNYSGHIYYMLITENPATAEDYASFCYLSILNNLDITTYPGIAQLINYYQDIQKRSTANAGVQRGGISKAPVGSMSAVISSAYSQNGASVAAKTARYTALQDDIPADTYFFINMKLGNSAASALTLNINSKGAHPIYINGEPSSATNYTLPARPYLVYYDGTNYYFNTDGTIPRVIHCSNGSIKNIVEISYADYQTLVANNTVDPKTEYHIVDGAYSQKPYIKPIIRIANINSENEQTYDITTAYTGLPISMVKRKGINDTGNFEIVDDKLYIRNPAIKTVRVSAQIALNRGTVGNLYLGIYKNDANVFESRQYLSADWYGFSLYITPSLLDVQEGDYITWKFGAAAVGDHYKLSRGYFSNFMEVEVIDMD